MKRSVYLIMPVICILCACGVKTGVVDMASLAVIVPADGAAVSVVFSDSLQDSRPVLGLLWQSDTLHVTFNRGHRLQTARVKKDTLYLYESPKDTSDIATRQYALHLPEQELFVIKYNDTLVYPVMPSAEGCEYPLDIKSLLTEKQQIVKEEKAQSQKTEYKYKPSASNSEPDADEKGIAGTYYWGHYIEPFLRRMQLDTTYAMEITEDGIWKEYRNDTLINCGIIRRYQRIAGYVMLVDAAYQVLMTDTKEINGHIHPVGDMWPYLRNGGRLPEGEYFFDVQHHMTEFRLYPIHSMSLPHSNSLILGVSQLICNGEVYGWAKKSKYHTYK